jgi:hypothetical protein
MRFAEFAVPAVLLGLVGGPPGVLYLLCAGALKLRPQPFAGHPDPARSAGTPADSFVKPRQ